MAMKIHFDPFSFAGRVSKFAWTVISVVACLV